MEVVHEVQRDVTRFPRPANHPATLRSTGKEVAATEHTSFSTEPQTSPQVPSPCPPLHSRSHAPAPARLSLACAPEKGPAPLARHGVAFAHLQFHRHRCVARLLPIRLAVPSCCFERRPGCLSAMHPSTYAVAANWSRPTARDLTLEAARDASNARKSSTQMLPSGQLKKLLDSRSERDVLEGLRRVVTVHNYEAR